MQPSREATSGLGRPISGADITAVRSIVLGRLRAAILDGTLEGGRRLLQEELASQLGVSRQPVREALRQLESEGLVERSPDRSTIVRTYSAQDISENYHLRAVLESESARLAADRITEAGMSDLQALHQEQRDAVGRNDLGRVVDLNQQFHLLITELAQMPTLTRLVSLLWVGHTVLTPLLLPERPTRSLAEHECIIEAIIDRQPDAAHAAMHAHILSASGDYRACQSDPPRGR